MRVRQYIVIAVLLATGAALVAGSSVGLGVSLSNPDEKITGQILQTDGDAQAENTSGMGEQVTSFMQSTAVDVDSTVESGLWEVSMNNTENASEAVKQRVESLEDQLSALENRSEQLNELQANGSTGPLYSAQASSVRVEIATIKSAIDQTEQMARTVGVNATKLESLRQNASNMTGPEVSEAARNITDIPQNGNGTGPSDNPGNGDGDDDDGDDGDDGDNRDDGDADKGDGDDEDDGDDKDNGDDGDADKGNGDDGDDDKGNGDDGDDGDADKGDGDDSDDADKGDGDDGDDGDADKDNGDDGDDGDNSDDGDDRDNGNNGDNGNDGDDDKGNGDNDDDGGPPDDSPGNGPPDDL